MKIDNMQLSTIVDLDWSDIVSSDVLKPLVLEQMGITEEELCKISKIAADYDEDEDVFEVFMESIDTGMDSATYSVEFLPDIPKEKVTWKDTFTLPMHKILQECYS